MKHYSILNEASSERTDIATLADARHAAESQAKATGYNHSVWESDDGETWTNTGDYYEGEHGELE